LYKCYFLWEASCENKSGDERRWLPTQMIYLDEIGGNRLMRWDEDETTDFLNMQWAI
jgi:hypothetical protein